jgi:Flp pilus assembly protein TadD
MVDIQWGSILLLRGRTFTSAATCAKWLVAVAAGYWWASLHVPVNYRIMIGVLAVAGVLGALIGWKWGILEVGTGYHEPLVYIGWLTILPLVPGLLAGVPVGIGVGHLAANYAIRRTLKRRRSTEARPLEAVNKTLPAEGKSAEEANPITQHQVTVAMKEAWRLMNSGRLPQAATALAGVAGVADGNPAFWVASGRLARKQGDYDAALTAYEKALSLAPNLYDAQKGVALTLAEAGRHDEAAGALRALQAARPTDWDLRIVLGDLLVRCRDLDGAKEEYMQALQMAADGRQRSAAHRGLGRVSVLMGDREQAEKCWRALMLISPEEAKDLRGSIDSMKD